MTMKKINRGIYGGSGDKTHLGGFTDIDIHGISPRVWKDMMEYFGIKSILDVGCGKGFSTTWFYLQGFNAYCVEGSHDAITKSLFNKVLSEEEDKEKSRQMLRKQYTKQGYETEKLQESRFSLHKHDMNRKNTNFQPHLIEHDFSRGPWWPSHTVDAIWCVEFLEHVGRNYQHNYFSAFNKAALLFVTHSNWGGWHHVEVHDDTWWINKLEMNGFVYSEEYTKRIRNIALEERTLNIKGPSGSVYNAQHIYTSMLVFFNPEVAKKPEHNHLLAEGGCFPGNNLPKIQCSKENTIETPLPKEYFPIIYNEKKHVKWEQIVKENLGLS